jgi:hypothetical protein
MADVLAEDGAQNLFWSDQVHPHVVVTCSENGPADLWIGGLVGTHRVNDDVDRHQATITGFLLEAGYLAGFLNGKDITALVGTALAAGAVRQLALVAVGALGKTGGGQEVVAAALGGALLGVAPFWIRHCSIPFASPAPDSAGEWRKN